MPSPLALVAPPLVAPPLVAPPLVALPLWPLPSHLGEAGVPVLSREVVQVM